MSDFHMMVEAAAEELAAIPGIADHGSDPALARMACVVALSRCRLTLATAGASVIATVSLEPDPSGDECGRALLEAVAQTARNRFDTSETPPLRDALGLDGSDITALGATLMVTGVGSEHVTELFETVSGALKTLQTTVAKAVDEHVGIVLDRDLGLPATTGARVPTAARWALCMQMDGRPERAEAIRRRVQALDAYGAVVSVLIEPETTAIIDVGGELAPALSARLGIDQARLRKLNGVDGAKRAMTAWRDRTEVIAKLELHDIALHRWPVELANETWRHHQSPLEPAYVDTSAKRDALDAFRRDVVQPLAVARIEALGLGDHPNATRFVAGTSVPDTPATLGGVVPEQSARKAWGLSLAATMIGGRSPKPYGEAVDRWHRRVASIAALRQEHTAPAPGWPALCEPWTSKDGRAAIVACITADALVEEGSLMQHCVGGYYAKCRSGETHILSLSIDGVRTATLELLVRPSGKGLAIRRGQFEGYRRKRPDDDAQTYVEDFLARISDGRHKVDAKKHIAFAQERAKAGYEYDRKDALPLDYIRRAWELYLPLLARGTAASFDEWMATTPLVAAIDAALLACATTSAGNGGTQRRMAA